MMKSFMYLVVGFATTKSFSVATDPLPECNTGIEVQFFNANIDISNLPPTCNKKKILDIGFIVQDVVESVDRSRPQFQMEKMHTTVCPLAQVVTSSSWEGVQRFTATGRAERCKSSNSSSGRSLNANISACSLAARAMVLQRKAEYAVSTSEAILSLMMQRSNSALFRNVDLSWHLEEATEGVVVCQEAAAVVALATNEVTDQCTSSSPLEVAPIVSYSKAKAEYERANAAGMKAKNALSRMRQVQHDLNVLHYVEKVEQSRGLDLVHRSLSSPTVVCAIASQAMSFYQEAKATVDECRSIMKDIQSLISRLGSNDVKDIEADAENTTKDCERRYEEAEKRADKAQFWCDKATGHKFQKNQPKHAQRETDGARDALNSEKSALSKLSEYQATLREKFGISSQSDTTAVGLATSEPTSSPTSYPTAIPTTNPTVSPTKAPTPSPTMSPTESPTSSPTVTPTVAPTESPTESPTKSPTARPTNTPPTPSENTQERPLDTSYLSRLGTNLDASNVNCEQVPTAVQQKTLAEEALFVGDAIFDEIVELSLGREDNEGVKNIRVDAFLTSLKIKDESAKAAAAAEMASVLCGTGGLDLVEEQTNVATEASDQTRHALDELRASRDVMEDMITLMGFDPSLSGLKSGIEEDEIALLKHLANVEDMLTLVVAQLSKLPEDSDEYTALKKKRLALELEELDVQDALAGKMEFQIGSSALKKDEFFASVSPDFDKNPPLQYVLQSSENATTVVQGGVTKEEYFRNFGESITAELFNRLFVGFSKKNGGCIFEDTELSVVVVITEVTSFWEQFVPAECETISLGRGPSRGSRR